MISEKSKCWVKRLSVSEQLKASQTLCTDRDSPYFVEHLLLFEGKPIRQLGVARQALVLVLSREKVCECYDLAPQREKGHLVEMMIMVKRHPTRARSL